MSDTIIQPIYLTTCLNDLKKRFKFCFHGKKPRDVYQRLSKIRDNGYKARKEGDEEQSYILLTRWLDGVEWLKKTKEYKDNKEFFLTYISNIQVNEVRNTVEELTQSLLIRYEEKNAKKVVQVMDAVENMQIKPDLSNGSDTSTPINDFTLTLPETPTDDPLSNESEETITCSQLFHLMQRIDSRILLIDIRSDDDYQTSRIKSDKCINIPADQIKLGVLATSFLKYLRKDKHAFDLFKCRGMQYVDTLILLDWCATRITLTSGNHLNILKVILKDWDPGVMYKKIVILEGGYSEWLNRYPAYVTNPSIKIPNAHDNAMDEILEDVEYPDWLHSSDEESPMKSMQIKSMPSKNSKPIYTDKKLSRIEKPSVDSQAIGHTRSLFDTTSVVSNFNNFEHANSFINTKSFEPLDNEKRVVPSYKVQNEDIDVAHLDTDEPMIQSKTLTNKMAANDIVKPIIDRSNKPVSLKAYNANSEAILSLMRLLNELVKNQEKLEKEILTLENELFRRYDEKNRNINEEEQIHARIKQLRSTLEEMGKKNSETRDELAKYKDNIVELSPVHHKEKVKLDLTIGSAEQQLKTMSIERKRLYGKRAEKELKKKLALTKQNESDVHKEPLKRDSPSMNSGLKRSFSSPNLAQLDDHKAPQVDRSSKPQQLLHRNQSNTNNNGTTKHSPISWKDREQRMEPVFRNVHPGITGLKNLGNSCYMNSIIQCLSNTACLAKYFNDNLYMEDLNTSNENGTQGQVAEEVAQVIKALWRGQYKSISPRDLKVVIGQYKLQFESYEQQDSHEFLTFLLDWVHNDLKRKVKLRIDGLMSVAEKEWDKAMGSQQSIISHLFFGQLRSSIFCATCKNSSITYETFNSLTMSLPHSTRCTLDDCIKKFVSGQKVSGWKCPNCKVAREATKKFDFVKLAPIVVIHLNRFGESDGWLEKRNTAVDFPLAGFNLKPYLVLDSDMPANPISPTNANQHSYSLYAMSNHYGTMEGGHYTAFCKSAAQNKWYKYDDHTVTEVSSGQVKSQNASAYLLFYTSFPNDPYTFI